MFKLRLNNFRGFLNEEFDFSRVNILIGENSAGKSSIFKFLLALKQSFDYHDNKNFNLKLSGKETDLGNYEEVIYNHETERNLSFSFEFGKACYEFFMKYNFLNYYDEDERHEVIEYLRSAESVSTALEYEIPYDLSKHNGLVFSASNSNIGTVKILFPDSKRGIQPYRQLTKERTKCKIVFESIYYNQTFNIENVEYDNDALLIKFDRKHFENKIEELGELERPDSKRLYFHIMYLLLAQDYLKDSLMEIKYINPLLYRDNKRVYTKNLTERIYEIKSIEDLVDFLHSFTEQQDFEEILINLLKEFGITESFTVKRDGKISEFKVKINDVESNIQDVGFGVSLQLPILAQALLSEQNRQKYDESILKYLNQTLLIEQPEVHLHPSLQAKFMDALLSVGNHNVYFIETHSEHIIRMLQVLVKTKKHGIKSEDISIHYFKKEGKQMVKSNHYINPETGKLTPNFPKGFYDVSYSLAFQLMD